MFLVNFQFQSILKQGISKKNGLLIIWGLGQETRDPYRCKELLVTPASDYKQKQLKHLGFYMFSNSLSFDWRSEMFRPV